MSLIGNNRRLSLACELGADRIVAARATSAGMIDVSAVRPLKPGAIAPNLAAANIADREAVRAAIQEAMAGVAGHLRDVIAVLPDGACHVSLLDFDSLPEEREEAAGVIRFRLKKSLPFDVDQARLSYHVQPKDKSPISVVAAVVLNTVLAEYESVLREAGYAPGIVIPSMLAALGQVDTGVPTLVIKVERATTSIAIVDHNRLVLLRTIENPAGTHPEPAQLAEDTYPSLVFFQDRYGLKVQKISVSGVSELEQFSAAIEEQAGLRAQELVSVSHLGGMSTVQRSSLGGVVGVLTSQSESVQRTK